MTGWSPTPVGRPAPGGTLPWAGRLRGLAYGGDYNPEQCPQDVQREDVDLMRQAGVTLVTVGVFAWSSIEPYEGRFEFDWLDRVLDLLHAADIMVALATPTASPPPWFSLAYPDGLPVNADGIRLSHGSRDTYCPSAPSYREAAARVAGALGARYGQHPALALWHVHNEYGTVCWCDHCAAAFRRWMRRQYGDLDALNDAWYTSFWSQRYSAWEQVRPPRTTQWLTNPAHELDYRRFCSDELLDCFREQRDVLRRHAPDVPATTNFVLAPWAPVEHWSWAAELDLVSVDSYPDPVDAEAGTAFDADLSRSWAGGRPWLLLEHATGYPALDGRMRSKEPGALARHSLSHIARGSQGAMFFQWRASAAGAEVHRPAMLPHAGADSRVFREVTARGELLGRLAEGGVTADPPPGTTAPPVLVADTAIVWADDAGWALDPVPIPTAGIGLWDAAKQVHRALWQRNVAVDFVAPDGDLARYRLVLIPSLYLVDDATARRLAEYVAAGGHLLVWFFTGIADEHHRVRLGGYPGAFRDLLGIRVEEFHALPPDGTVALSTGACGRVWSEDLRVAGAEVIASYAAGQLSGHPAVTRNRVGAGQAWYLSTQLTGDDLVALLRDVADAAGVTPVLAGAPAGVEAVRRQAADATYLFLLNHTAEEQKVAAAGTDVVTGERIAGSLTIPAGGVGVVREAAAPHPPEAVSPSPAPPPG